MRLRKNQHLTKVWLWFVMEIVLGFAGLDDLADYSEFIFERNAITCQKIGYE